MIYLEALYTKFSILIYHDFVSLKCVNISQNRYRQTDYILGTHIIKYERKRHYEGMFTTAYTFLCKRSAYNESAIY